MKISSFLLPASIALLSSAQEIKPMRAQHTSEISRNETSTETIAQAVLVKSTSTSTASSRPSQTFSSKPSKGNASKDPYTRCATHPDDDQRSILDAVSLNRTYTYKATRQVDVYIHIVTTEAKRNSYTQKMIEDQVSTLNDAYSSIGFSFTLEGSDFTVQEDWAQASAGSDAETEMKQALHMGSYADLNLYFLSDLGDGLLGFCYFPTENPSPSMRVLDGCINLADSLPGGEAENYNLGLTAVHEVGHWFGLYHVFDGNKCTGNGDFVSDTPMQSEATFGCPTRQDSCPEQEGQDAVHNYMDYSYDQCLTEFTSGQAQRARALFDEYRAGN
ncbi:Putative peptidase M43, pregnancy-associated plasma-A [Septoria linicola]|uniref:Peptidase M43, pregnancy-associated plasma-A n=1 Tax=Septoria linicola TaxID=215465 RepID=A0A9Q9EM31_9PEZI|nr:putative peptidase M43, pregnancy-associated plasma-A [Septoria linicola]USW56401.1 Putative peptidase M43, pregnancy-associated plasma-A [Septoria linicola]